MLTNINDPITDFFFCDFRYSRYIERDGFIFRVFTSSNIYNSIVIRDKSSSDCASPSIKKSQRSLTEHIEIINKMQLETATIIAEDISFIRKCPSLKHIEILVSETCRDTFDFSPLYDMPEISSLRCKNEQFGSFWPDSTMIDYSKIKGLKHLWISGKGHLNYQKIKTLETLDMTEMDDKDLLDFDLPQLKELCMMACKLESLSGIEKFQRLQSVDLCRMRRIRNIDSIGAVSSSLRMLSIENCPKIISFEVLSSLSEMEGLVLNGRNVLSDLDFLKKMSKLRFFHLTMNVLDGNLDLCMNIPYVDVQCKKHYNRKNKELPKNNDIEGFVIK